MFIEASKSAGVELALVYYFWVLPKIYPRANVIIGANIDQIVLMSSTNVPSSLLTQWEINSPAVNIPPAKKQHVIVHQTIADSAYFPEPITRVILPGTSCSMNSLELRHPGGGSLCPANDASGRSSDVALDVNFFLDFFDFS